MLILVLGRLSFLGFQYLRTLFGPSSVLLLVVVLYAFYGFVVAERDSSKALSGLWVPVFGWAKSDGSLCSRFWVLFFLFNFRQALLPLGMGL